MPDVILLDIHVDVMNLMHKPVFFVYYLNDSVLAVLDDLTQLLCTLRLETLMKDLLKHLVKDNL